MGGRWMLSGRWMLVGAVALLASCGVDPADNPGGLFGFSGTWTLTPATGLVLEPCAFGLRDSKGTARCSGSELEEYGPDERYIREVTLNADAVLTETVITLDATWTRVDTEVFNDEEYRRACTITVSGRAEREAGRQDEGRFGAVAGTWTGTARYAVDCEDDFDRRLEETVDLRFDAGIFGDSAEISWRELGDDFERLVAVQHVDDVGLRIDGVAVPEVLP